MGYLGSMRTEVSPPLLLCFPTELERSAFEAAGPHAIGVPSELVGFGPIAAAARCAQLFAKHRPERALLIGIAGSFDPERAPLGSARAFGEVLLDGVGAGLDPARCPPSKLGFPQWPGDATTPEIYEGLPLGRVGPTPEPGSLLTVCSASGSPEQARKRREHFPDAVAEDMEAFGFALACALAGVPCGVVRGISNPVGVREDWLVREAMAQTRLLVESWLREDPTP